MPINPPALDDRSFDDLVSELVARIPAHTPEWTHPRAGDPGRTLIELFAWLGDTILYRANLIPERQRLAFLRLLGMPLKPAVPARGIVGLQVDDERDPKAVDVPPRALIEKPVPFSTANFVTAYPLLGRAYIKRALTADEEKTFNALLPDLTAVYRLEGQQPAGYMTTEIFENGAMNPAGVDFVADTVDQSLWIALMAPSAKTRAAARAALDKGADGAPRAMNVGVALAYDVPGLTDDIGSRARIPVIWEMTTGQLPANTAGAPTMLVLEELENTTQGYYRHGIVRLGLPAISQIGAPGNDPRENLGAGVGDTPPRLDAPADAERLVAWLRLRVRPDFPVSSLKLSWIGINAVEIEQQEDLPSRAVGTSDGGSDQSFDLGTVSKGSVDAATLRIEVRDPVAGNAPWVGVDDLGAWGPLDQIYRLDPEAGTISFGDGVHGRVPSAGSQIIARGLRVGGGRAGNQAPGSLAKLDSLIDLVTRNRRKPDKPLKVVQALPTRGGSDSETIVEAERRIPGYFRHRDRAVTVDDYRALAREAPGVSVARVEVLPRFKPHERQGDIPGVVSVMVLPAKATQDFTAPYPRADRPLLETVHAFLDLRRPLATELYAIGCVYKPLGVSVAVQISDGFPREQVLGDVRIALRRHLWPLPLGLDGSAGDWAASRAANAPSDGGYPLGRPLTDRELEVVAARVPGVGGVSAVRLFELSGGKFREVAGAGKAVSTFTLEPFELPELTTLLVVEGVDAPASLDSPFGPASGTGGNTVAVPIVPDVC